VLGREQAVRIFALLAKARTPLPPAQEKSYSAFAAGLEAYRQQHWSEVLAWFKLALDLWPADGPSRVMAEHCLLYQKNPPLEGWNEVFEALYK
jgi:hypothetical protein